MLEAEETVVVLEAAWQEGRTRVVTVGMMGPDSVARTAVKERVGMGVVPGLHMEETAVVVAAGKVVAGQAKGRE